MTDVPFGFRSFVWLTESFGRLVVAIVVDGVPPTTLELDPLFALGFAELVVLATKLEVVELNDDAAIVVTTTDGATDDSVDSVNSTVSPVVVTKVSLSD